MDPGGNIPRPISPLVPWLLSSFLGACGSHESAPPGEVTLSEIDTLITTQSGLLVQPVAMAVDREGTLLVLDGQMAQVHRVAADGSVLPSLGQQGSGPGEFQRPSALRLSGDTLWVIDSGNGRLQVLDIDGNSIETYSLPPRAGYYISRLTTDGRILGSTLGQDSCLTMAYDKTA